MFLFPSELIEEAEAVMQQRERLALSVPKYLSRARGEVVWGVETCQWPPERVSLGVYDAVSTSLSWHGAPAVAGAHALDANARWALRCAHPALYELAMSRAVSLTLAPHAPNAEMCGLPAAAATTRGDSSQTTATPGTERVSVQLQWCVPRPPHCTCAGTGGSLLSAAPTLVDKHAAGTLVRTKAGYAILWDSDSSHSDARRFGSARAVLRFSDGRETDPFAVLEWSDAGLAMLMVFKRWREEENEAVQGLTLDERRRLGIGMTGGEVVAYHDGVLGASPRTGQHRR
ncbi:hypothetical protein TRAPUB_3604 [Trametes pubescens]|uniref:Uncharacterized protein n=1 Tax=Trametes pubescens TaxID=154538 RepID=A0A1M2VD63_TRAPU|nr:hypothetical protein TRAPUB_3604 [Trametes pubescens]